MNWLKENLFKSLLIAALIVPQFAFAAWWNPFSWKVFSWLPWANKETPSVIVESDELSIIIEDATQVATSTNISSSTPESDIKEELEALKEQLRVESEKRTTLEKKLQGNQSAAQKTQTTYIFVPQTTIQNTLTSDEIYSLVKPSIVLISSPDGSHGTGFVINDGRYTITNQHVVEKDENTGEVYKNVTVRLNDGTMFQGVVLGVNKESDLALIYNGKLRPPALKFGGSNLKTGSDIYAVGFPRDFTSIPTLTKGIVSVLRQKTNFGEFIQTDAAVNPGNSGGPLVDNEGKVVGINDWRLTTPIVANNGQIEASVTEGISFAIPIETAIDLIPSLSQYGQSRYEVYPIGSTQTINRSMQGNIDLNTHLSCDTLGYKDNDLAVCELYRNYKGDYNWQVTKDY